ncbi:MAG: hypothetical protein HFH10_10105 [Dorea sp.]|nr:hypothetical protein [Dorea sp.]
MEHTVKLFYEDTAVKEFDAAVLSCGPVKDGYEAVLDRTAFFPEGGGQYGDTGWIDGIPVTDTREKGGIIYHYVKEPLEAGRQVHGRLDWDIRFERMQQHSAEHIVSGIIHRRFGYENVGFHLGADYCTMDFNGPITKEQLREIEEEANRAVFADLPVYVLYPDKETLAQMEYRSKIEIEGQVRIIEIPGIDVCACCAPHVESAGQIGLIKLVDMTNYKGGERIHMLSGIRALKDYQRKQESARKIGNILCEQESKLVDAVEHMRQEDIRLKGEIAGLRKQILRNRAGEIDVTEHVVIVFEEGLSGDEAREFMNFLLERGAGVCAVFTGTEEAGYRYVIGSRTEDVRPLNERLKENFGARGGGRPEMVQGSLTGTRDRIKVLL